MTSSRGDRGPGQQLPLVPARSADRRGPAQPSPSLDYDDVEIARGQSAAVLGALGRMQLRLDVLAREQSTALGDIRNVLQRLDLRLAQIEAQTATVVTPDPGQEPPPPPQ